RASTPNDRSGTESTAAASACEPALEASLWRGNRAVNRRLRRHGSKAQPPRASGLAIRQAGAQRLVHPGNAPADLDLEYLPKVELTRSARRTNRPIQHAFASEERPATGSRIDPRYPPGCFRPAQAVHVWTKRARAPHELYGGPWPAGSVRALRR